MILTRNILRFVIVVSIQVLLLNNFKLFGIFSANLYLYFILLLPIEIAGWALLFLALICGTTIDLLSGTPGLHTSALLVTAFIRPMVMRLISSAREFESGMQPGLRDLGLSWFVRYSLILVFIHHIILYSLEYFSLVHPERIIMEAVYSSLFTTSLMLFAELMFSNRKDKRT